MYSDTVRKLVPRINGTIDTSGHPDHARSYVDRVLPGTSYLSHDIRRIEDVLTRAERERPLGLQGSDADRLPASALVDGVRYLVVRCPGRVSGFYSSMAAPTTDVFLSRRGEHVVPEVELDVRPTSTWSTIAVGPSLFPGAEVAYWSHPGPPSTDPDPRLEEYVGRHMEVRELRSLLGGDDVWVAAREATWLRGME